jgi:hypothetical protein
VRAADRVVSANRISATQTMEEFIPSRSARVESDGLRPVYSVVPTDRWQSGPRRSQKLPSATAGARAGNAAADQAKHDARQHHPRGDADVLRPAAAAPGVRACFGCSRRS